MKPNYDFSNARRGAVIPASGNKDKNISANETRKQLSILTANVKKSTQKAKVSLDKGPAGADEQKYTVLIQEQSKFDRIFPI